MKKTKPNEKSPPQFARSHPKVVYPPAVRDLIADWEKLRCRDLKELRECRDDAQFAEFAVTYLFRYFGSADRLPAMLELLKGRSRAVVFRVFLEVWPNCDDTWAHKEAILRCLRPEESSDSCLQYFSPAVQGFIETLPDVITVYRGCSRSRANGLSWTLDPEVARSFATGHRNIRVNDPVIVTAEVEKKSILAPFLDDRCEAELLCEPTRITKIDDFRS
jgi:hypothetical protein